MQDAYISAKPIAPTDFRGPRSPIDSIRYEANHSPSIFADAQMNEEPEQTDTKTDPIAAKELINSVARQVFDEMPMLFDKGIESLVSRGERPADFGAQGDAYIPAKSIAPTTSEDQGVGSIPSENLDFWMRFSSSFSQVQKLQSEIEDLQKELAKMNENEKKKKKEGSSTPERTLKSDARPIYKHNNVAF